MKKILLLTMFAFMSSVNAQHFAFDNTEFVFRTNWALTNQFVEIDTNPFRDNAIILKSEITPEVKRNYGDTSMEFYLTKSDNQKPTITLGFRGGNTIHVGKGNVHRRIVPKKISFIIDRDVSNGFTITELEFKESWVYEDYYRFTGDVGALMDKIIPSKVVHVMMEGEIVITKRDKSVTRKPYKDYYLLPSFIRVKAPEVLENLDPTFKNTGFQYRLGMVNINEFDLEAYVDVFLKDAKENHDLTLRPGRVSIRFTQLEGETIARAWNTNRDGVVVEVDPENWKGANPIMRWYIIYHELGHDILNLEHGQGGPLLRPVAPKYVTYEQLEEYKTEMFEYYKN